MIKNKEDLEAKFKEQSPRLLEKYLAQKLSTVDLIYKAVGNNTIRAYHRGKHYSKYKPMSIYRYWAQEFLKENLGFIIECSDFTQLHNKAHNDLKTLWEKEDGIKEELPFYSIAKLIDLTFKLLPCWKKLPEDRQKWYLNEVHVPLDKYSLGFLKKHSEKFSKDIPSNASMGFIGKDQEKYKEIQNEIKKICYVCEIPPIVFDLLAWDDNHKRKQSKIFKLIECKK